MANVVHKFLKNRSSLRIITSLNPSQCSKLASSRIPLQTIPNVAIEQESERIRPLSNPVLSDDSKSAQPLRFYPSFPFGYWLNPISPSGSDLSEKVDAEFETKDASADHTVYCDSVKKKRKRKMNKHKYKKLRKSLRKKT